MKKGDFLSDEEKKKHSFGSKIKEIVVCRLSKGLAIGLASMALVAGGLSLAGCGPTEVETPPSPVPTEKIDAVLDDMELGNYTYSHKTEQETVDYLLDKDKMQTASEDVEKYYYTVDGEAFNLIYDQSDSLWHKTEAEKFDFDSIIYDDLSSATWSAFDEKTNEFTGKMNGEDVTLEISSNGSVSLQGNDFEGTIYNIGSTTVNLPSLSMIVDDTKQQEIPVEKVNEFLAEIDKNNFTYTENVNGSVMNYFIEGDTWKVYEDNDNIGHYYYVEDGKAYLLNYDKTDNMWHKTETDLRDTKELVYNDLINVNWTSFDSNENVITGEVDGKEVNLKFNSSSVVVYGDDYEKTIYNIGNTTVNMPEASKIVDDTTIITPPPVDETDKIYTVDENGNYVFNIPAMASVLDKWMKGDNQYNKDYLAEYWLVTEDVSHVDKILYIDATLDKIDVVVISETNGKGGMTTFRFNDSNFYDKIKNQEIETTQEFEDYLNSTKYKQFSPVGSTITFEYSTDTATNDQLSEFKTMTENIFTKIATKGTQVGSIKNDYENPIPEFADAKVLFGFKTPAGGTVAGLDMGYIKSWQHYYILDIDGNIELATINIASSITVNNASDEKQNVLNGDDNGYMITKVERDEINNENKLLFENNAEQTKTDVYYMTNKEREL